ncbi:MAG TPA: hypothetical protein VGB85_27290, partial [Nannocystis sp.]
MMGQRIIAALERRVPEGLRGDLDTRRRSMLALGLCEVMGGTLSPRPRTAAAPSPSACRTPRRPRRPSETHMMDPTSTPDGAVLAAQTTYLDRVAPGHR